MGQAGRRPSRDHKLNSHPNIPAVLSLFLAFDIEAYETTHGCLIEQDAASTAGSTHGGNSRGATRTHIRVVYPTVEKEGTLVG